ncbi:hypothetical protein SteCoe_24731 [Stentor coeruleus]|uniref:Calreticulin n=1 Tax=Stentor coeruleus TaxID=5963 RepID=A0A1R2BHA4_9CILI|nr:hypothetical protein SteCoe_24731 [Stentor coeruleus]
MKLSLVVCLLAAASAKIYFQETFNFNWFRNWLVSSAKNYGNWAWTPGSLYADTDDYGIQTADSNPNYAISASFPAFTSFDMPLIIQYTLKNEQPINCGGGYIKILPKGFNQLFFSEETPYLIMFGPDYCNGEGKGQLIIPYKGYNYNIQVPFNVANDEFTHQYTLVINPDEIIDYYIDNVLDSSIKIEEYFYMPGNYNEDAHIITNIGGVGIEIAQSNPGSIFDNIFIGDSLEEARAFSEMTFVNKAKGEKEAKENFEKELMDMNFKSDEENEVIADEDNQEDNN